MFLLGEVQEVLSDWPADLEEIKSFSSFRNIFMAFLEIIMRLNFPEKFTETSVFQNWIGNRMALGIFAQQKVIYHSRTPELGGSLSSSLLKSMALGKKGHWCACQKPSLYRMYSHFRGYSWSVLALIPTYISFSPAVIQIALSPESPLTLGVSHWYLLEQLWKPQSTASQQDSLTRSRRCLCRFTLSPSLTAGC